MRSFLVVSFFTLLLFSISQPTFAQKDILSRLVSGTLTELESANHPRLNTVIREGESLLGFLRNRNTGIVECVSRTRTWFGKVFRLREFLPIFRRATMLVLRKAFLQQF